MAFMNLIMGQPTGAQAEEDFLEGHGDEDYNVDEEEQDGEEDEGEASEDGGEGETVEVQVTQADNDAIQRLIAITGFS